MRYWVFALLFLAFLSCEEVSQDNPFDDLPPPTGDVDPDSVELNPDGIDGIHANIFRPICANSGCHDGTFEPDFRTIESAYNTLVFQPIIKNDPQGSFEYRVQPGDPTKSVIIARLTYDIDGFSGIMPLVVDPGSDWLDKKDEYIGNIRTWIQSGARDIFGNSPIQQNGLPQMIGVVGRSDDWLDREDSGQGALRVPLASDSLDIYFAFSDDETPSDQLLINKIKFSTGPDLFDNAMEMDLVLLNNPVIQQGYYGGTVSYYHKIKIDPHSMAALDEFIFFRVYIQDQNNPVTEIPSDGGAYYVKDYFSFTIIE